MINSMTKEEKETELKWKFAESLLRNPNDPFKAAMAVTYGDTVAALTILSNWQNSIEINQMKAHLIEEMGEDAFLPTEAQLLRSILDRAERTIDDAHYAKLMGLVLDAKGYTSKAKAGPSVVVNNNTNNKTMLVPIMVNNSGQEVNDDEWEAQLIEQQQRLVSGVQ